MLGAPVTLTGAGSGADSGGRGGAAGPVTTAEFRTAAGAALVVTVLSGGPAAPAIRAHRGGAPVPGVGDEAFASGRWAVARRGGTVLTIAWHGAGPVPQPSLVWLLGLAAGRLS